LLHGIQECDLHLYFREFKPYIGKCAFGMSCTHTHEKGCALIQAVEDGEISPERFDSWHRIADEMKTGKWED
ncbi:MAG: ribosome small subunit-dependent GTPase A, partial [Treponema sp.]|nr:ribosome small subunit-dependent GTPase A [Treponema sp.]